MDGYRRVVRNLLALLLNQLGTWSISLVLVLIVPRYLGATRYGLYSFVGAYVGIFAIGMALGTGTYLTWRIAREPEVAGQLTLNTLALQLPLAVLSSVLALAIVHQLDSRPTVLYLTAITLGSTVLGAFAGTCSSALAGMQLMWVPVRIGLLASAVSATVMVAGVFVHADLLFLAASGIVGQTLGLGVLLLYTLGHIPLKMRIDIRLWRNIVLGGLPFLTWAVVLLVYGQIDISMLKLMVGDAEVGWYAAAYRIIGIPVFLPTIITAAVLPALSAERDPTSPTFRTLVSRSLRLVMAVGVPACAGTLVVAGSLLSILHYPASFDHATPLIAILALHMPIVGVDMVLGTVFIAIGRRKVWVGIGVIAAIFNPLMNLWAIPYTQQAYGNGAIGASVVTVLTEVLILIGALVLRPRTVMTRGDILYFLRCVLATGFMAPVAWVLSTTRLGVLGAVGGGIAIYALAAFVFKVIGREELSTVAGLLKRKVGGATPPSSQPFPQPGPSRTEPMHAPIDWHEAPTAAEKATRVDSWATAAQSSGADNQDITIIFEPVGSEQR